MIRVAIVDDHEAVRAGLHNLLRSEPGIVPVGAASGEADLWPMLKRTRPDVVIVDFQMPGRHGLLLCHRIKSGPKPPRVMVYSAFADEALALPAILAGADAVVNKGATASELFECLREVSRDRRPLPAVTPSQMQVASTLLSDEDLPVVGMLLERTPPDEVAAVLGLEPDELDLRIERIVGRLVTVGGS